MTERLKVILTQVNTYLVLASTIITIIAAEMTPLLDNRAAGIVAQLAVTATAWIGAATAIIRRSTEVPLSERGILPR